MWIVSNCTKAPGFSTLGLGMGLWYFFHLLFCFTRPDRLRTLFTLLRLTAIPICVISWWITSAHRRLFNRSSIMRSTVDCGRAWGWLCGRELSVCRHHFDVHFAFSTHRITVVWWTPKWQAVRRILQPESTCSTAFLRTLWMWGLEVYGMFIAYLGGAKLLNHYGIVDMTSLHDL